MAAEKRPDEQDQQEAKNGLRHVGGLSDSLGGVDPAVEEDLLRLSGGP
jgi:hypothetical protein